MSAQIDKYLKDHSVLGAKICDALRNEVVKLGFPDSFIEPDFNLADYSLNKDPASGKDSLIGIWRDDKGFKKGEILFHADGSFFSEYDVISNHPKKNRWFVESVTAWGRNYNIKCEAKLLPLTED